MSFDTVGKLRDASSTVAKDVVEEDDETSIADASAAVVEGCDAKSRIDASASVRQILFGLDEAHADNAVAMTINMQHSIEVFKNDSRTVLAFQNLYHAGINKSDKELVASIDGGCNARNASPPSRTCTMRSAS